MLQLLDDPDQLDQMGKKGRSWVLERLSLQRIAAEMKTLYEKLIRETKI